MKLKKITAILLAAAMALSIFSCSSTSSRKKSKKKSKDKDRIEKNEDKDDDDDVIVDRIHGEIGEEKNESFTNPEHASYILSKLSWEQLDTFDSSNHGDYQRGAFIYTTDADEIEEIIDNWDLDVDEDCVVAMTFGAKFSIDNSLMVVTVLELDSDDCAQDALEDLIEEIAYEYEDALLDAYDLEKDEYIIVDEKTVYQLSTLCERDDETIESCLDFQHKDVYVGAIIMISYSANSPLTSDLARFYDYAKENAPAKVK